MIGRLVAFADMLVDPAIAQPIQPLRREQNMVDADAVILAPGAGLIVPERILPGRLVTGAEGIGIAQMFDGSERGSGLRLKQSVVDPGLGIVAIPVFGNDVVIP